MRRHRNTLAAEEGMTLVELMVAAMVLVVGMLAIGAMLTTGFRKTGATAQRVAATNLARELTEAARIATYEDLSPARVVTAVRAANPNLGGGTPWKVQRRNTVFTITASACAYDDPADKIAAPPPVDRCAPTAGSSTVTGDLNGDDFRRVTFTLSWREGARTRSFAQTALVVNPAGGLGPRILPPLPSLGPVTSPAQSSIGFTINTTTAASLHWNVDDGASSGDAAGGPTTWNVSWPIGTPGTPEAIADGTYSIGLQAFSDRGIPGDARSIDITLNRTAPAAPTGFAGGHNTRAGDWVEFEWALNAERDVIGYRVYDAGPDKAVGTSDDTMVCPTAAGTWLANTAITCQDLSPRAEQAKYYLVALDRDTAAAPRQGAATVLDVGGAGNRPAPPQNVTLSAGPSISWSAPSSGGVAFYRVYRDGTAPDHRIGRLPAAPYKDDAAVSGPHDYYVSSVDAKYNESDLVGPLRWSGP